MGTTEIGQNLLQAERLVRIDGDAPIPTVGWQADEALAELEEAQDLLNRQKEIHTETDERLERVLGKMKEVQEEIATISDLLGEGISNGQRVQAHGQSAVSHIDGANEKLDEAKGLVVAVGALDSELSRSFRLVDHRLGEGKQQSQQVTELGTPYGTLHSRQSS